MTRPGLWTDVKTAGGVMLLAGLGAVGLETIMANIGHSRGMLFGVAMVVVDVWFWYQYIAQRRKDRAAARRAGRPEPGAVLAPRVVFLVIAFLLVVGLLFPVAFIHLLDRW
jgi:hypothetical protein